MIAAGVALDDWALRQQGLDLLGWLIEYETAGDHLSPTPAGGRAPDDVRPAFDQQPIEVSTLADACARAATIDPASIWPNGVRAAAAWFMGANDARQLMWDPQPAVDSTACTPMGSTATRARSRLWQCSRRCNTLDDSRLCGNDFRAEWAPYTQPPTALGQPFAGHHPDSSCQARKVSSDKSGSGAGADPGPGRSAGTVFARRCRHTLRRASPRSCWHLPSACPGARRSAGSRQGTLRGAKVVAGRGVHQRIRH